MASQNPNILKRAYENLMGTPEQNKKAEESNKRYLEAKEKEKEDAKKQPLVEEPPLKKRKGGSVTMASRRGDGVAIRGKTKAGIK